MESHGIDMEKTWKFNSENPWPPWESAQDYQENDFRDELEVSAPTHPLIPTSLSSINTVNHKLWSSQNWQTGGRSRMRVHWKVEALLTKSSCRAQLVRSHIVVEVTYSVSRTNAKCRFSMKKLYFTGKLVIILVIYLIFWSLYWSYIWFFGHIFGHILVLFGHIFGHILGVQKVIYLVQPHWYHCFTVWNVFVFSLFL